MEALDQILKRRLVGPPWYRSGSVIGAVIVHVLFGLGAFVAPRLFAERTPPQDFVAVTIVPAAALGQIAPPPQPQPAAPEPEPEPEPEPAAPPPPEPAPVPVAKPTVPPPERLAPQTRPPAPRPERLEPRPATPPETRPTEPRPFEPQRREGSPQGNPLATGGPAEISGFDDPDFTYSYYADLMLARIRAVWARPPIDGDIKMTIYYRIHEDGHLSEVRVIESSGYQSFDRAGLRAVQTANMPPLPKSYRKESLGVRLVIR